MQYPLTVKTISKTAGRGVLLAGVLFFCFCLTAVPVWAAEPRQETAAAADFESGRAAYNAQDWMRAIAVLRPLAERGDARAAVLLGNMYIEGYGVAEDPDAAFVLYRQAAAANNFDGILTVASIYQAGIGSVPQNVELAIKWFERGAKLGSQQNAFFYALHLYRGNRGESFDFKPDHPAAYKWFRLAARRGTDARMQIAAREFADALAPAIPPGTLLEMDKAVENFVPATAAQLGPLPEETVAKDD